MSPQSSGPHVEISDLMEASFWEANKGRIIALIALITIGILVWQYVAQQAVESEQRAWDSLLAPPMLAPTADREVAARVDATSAGPWAKLVAARNYYQEEKYDDAENMISALLQTDAAGPVNLENRAAKLQDDIVSEKKWRAGHPPRTANPEVPADRVVTLTTDVGEIGVGLYTEQAPAAVREFLKLARDGRLVVAQFEEGEAESEIVLFLRPKEGEATAPPITLQRSEVERVALRKGGGLSHFKGTVSFRTEREKPEDPATVKAIVVALRDRLDLDFDADSVPFGAIQSGLDALLEASKRKESAEGKLEPPLKIQAAKEGAGLAAVGT